MIKIKLALCEKNEIYRRKFGDYLIEKKANSINITSITSVSLLQSKLKERQFDIILLGGGFERTTMHSLKIKDGHINQNSIIIRLVDDEDKISDETEKNIFKYQSGDEIVRQIFYYYQSLELRENTTFKNNKEIIAFYSPCNSRLRTPFALTYAQVFAKEKKVLYINLAEWSGFAKWFMEEYNRDLADLLYLITSKNINIRGILESSIYRLNNDKSIYFIDEKIIEI